MHSEERYIHVLTDEDIEKINKSKPWEKNYNQKINSAITNDNDQKEPDEQLMSIEENTAGINAYADIKFNDNVKTVLDVGGGKYDFISQYVQLKMGISVLVWDQFNRSSAHYNRVMTSVLKNKVDAATSMSVLNVIMELEVRLKHISLLKASLKIGGNAYFKIWSGALPLKGSYLPLLTKSFYQSNAGPERFLEEVQMIFGKNNAQIHKIIPNLIVAKKLTENYPRRQDILEIQKQSRQKLLIFNQKRDKAIYNLYSSYTKIFYINYSLFKKMENNFLEKNRYSSSKLQHEYDKRKGLILAR